MQIWGVSPIVSRTRRPWFLFCFPQAKEGRGREKHQKKTGSQHHIFLGGSNGTTIQEGVGGLEGNKHGGVKFGIQSLTCVLDIPYTWNLFVPYS